MKAKNILKTLALPVAVALGMMATSCSSDDNIVNEQQAVAAKYEIPVTVSATRSGDEGTRAVYDSNTRKLTFEDGDKLFIQGTDATAGTFAGVLSNTSGAPGTFSGTVVTENPYTGTSEALFASATSLTATLLPKDYSTTGYLTLSGEGASQTLTIDATKAFVTAASAEEAKALAIEQLSLEQATTYSSGFALQAKNAIINYAISSLSASSSYSPSITDGTTTVSGSVDSDTDGKAYFAVGFTVDGSTSKDYTLTGVGVAPSSVPAKAFSVSSGTITASGKTLEPNKVYNKTATASAFKYVEFSKGNLQYNKSTSTWSFMEHQYDIVETLNQNVGNNYASQDVVSLFGWGTSGKTFTSGYGSAYQPYATSATIQAYGPSDGTSGLTGTYADGDWGVNMGSGWRTLTGGSGGEWEYLFNTRTTATTNMPTGTNSGAARYTKATVAEVPGVILFPDNYAHPDGVTVTVSDAAYNTGNKAYTTFTVDASNWVTMESAGCVFLPAAGARNGTSVFVVGSYGFYRSSTAHNDDTGYAYIVSFGSEDVYPASYSYRNFGFSVRLVRPVE